MSSSTSLKQSIFNVYNYGAVGDGNTSDTKAIHAAIDVCTEAGGGVILFPPGNYLTGTIHLKSHISLVFEAGARLIGTSDLDQYQNFNPPSDVIESKWKRWHRALILGDGVENITISGAGIIDGNKVFDPKGEEKMRGPHTILLGDCQNVVIRDITIQDSANYAILMEHSHDIEIRNVKFTGGWDGVHFRGWKDRPCRNVSIIGCQFFTGDDSIAGRYWDNVLITNCIINSSCNGIRLIGPAERLIIHDCLFYGPGLYEHRTSKRTNMLAGINLQPGGWDATEGALDDVLISDITMKNVATPFHFVLKPGNTSGRITVGRVDATGVYRSACTVESWAETPFENVVFRDMNIEFEGGGTRNDARRKVKNPGVDARPLPAWGFYAKNVNNLQLEDIHLSVEEEGLRPVMICEHVNRLFLNDFHFPRQRIPKELMRFHRVNHIHLTNTEYSLLIPSYQKLDISQKDASENRTAGIPLSATVTVQNMEEDGIAKVELEIGEHSMLQWVWMRSKQKQKVVFRDILIEKPGTYELRAGNQKKTIKIKP